MKFRIEVTSMNIDKYLDILKKYNLEKEKETEYEEEKYFITINNLEELIQFHKEINHGIIIDTFLLLSQEVEERLAEHLTARIEEANSYILKKIGEAIKQISTLIPSQAYQIQQILKYRAELMKK